MAGDLPFEEILVIHSEDTSLDLAEPGAPAAPPEAREARVLHRFGDRVEILRGSGDSPGTQVPDVSAELLEGLNPIERLGVEALQLRATDDYIALKANRPRDGEVWDMPGCAGAPVAPPPPTDAPYVTLVPGAAQAEELGAEVAGAPGTSDFLQGSVAVGVVIVNGPTAPTQFSAAEQTTVVAEVQAGLGWLGGFDPWAGVTFNYDVRIVSITTQPDAAAFDYEGRWRDPAVGRLGFQQNWNGVWDYVNWLRNDRHTRWAYCVFFVKGYPLDHFAYASIGGPRVVMDFANDGWGPVNIDRVLAHETGHIFGCPDEYASSGCSCGGAWGRFGEPNSNCENCAGAAGVGCLMRANEWQMCGATTRHLGWGLTSLRTTQPSACHVVSRSQDHLDVFVADGSGATLTAAWEPAMVSWWEGWWGLLGGRAAPGAQVTVVSRRQDFLDVFVVGTDGGVWTCAWTPASGWQGWWRIGSATFPQGAMVTAVSRSHDKLDIFATDTAGRVLTAAWEPGFSDGWHGWWHLNGGRARPGAPVSTAVRSPDHLDAFVVGTDGGCYTAAWEPAFGDGWHGWRRIGGETFPQGAYVGAVSRSADKLDIFATDVGGRVLSAAWEPAFSDGWHGWWHILGGMAAPGGPVTAVSRSADKLDIFVVGTDNIIYAAAWEPAFADGWHGWWNLMGGRAAHGSFVTGTARRQDFLDVFMVGLDGRVHSAAWSPGNPWAGWWPMGK